MPGSKTVDLSNYGAVREHIGLRNVGNQRVSDHHGCRLGFTFHCRFL